MKKKSRFIAGLIFLVICTLAISFISIRPDNTTPIQSTESRQASINIGMGRGIALMQEVTANKDFLTGVSLVFTQNGRTNTNQNTLLILDTAYNVLERKVFSSSILKEGDYDLFSFKDPVYIGEGNKFVIALFSIDGQETNSASPLMNMKDSIGEFYYAPVDASDVIASLKKKIPSGGNLMLKTFETNYSQNWLLKIMLYVLILLITIVIILGDKIAGALAKSNVRPEFAYLGVALVFASLFTYITPPFQVPDAGTHFKLSYNVSEFGFLDKQKTAPLSISTMDTHFMSMRFLAGVKITRDEIREKFSVKAEPKIRANLYAEDYTLPYIPQALGIFLGRLVSDSLLVQMYFGRVFNLLIAILIMFFAIRLVPEPFKILMMLLALMPKTVFLFGSLSYDSFTISLSFLSIAFFLNHIYDREKEIGFKDLGLMALLMILLLLVKPPYFLIGGLFLLIPPKKFGKIYKFIWIGVVAVVGVVLFLKVIPMVSKSLEHASKPEVLASVPALTDSIGPDQQIFFPEVQMKAIFDDFPGYLSMIFKSGFIDYRTYIVESFVGVLGYIDVELPDLLSYAYLVLILFTSVSLATGRIRIKLGARALFALLFLLTFFIVETAMWMYATRPGRDVVFGVQGRYFIPMAPLLFMIFYNRLINPKLNLLFSLRRKEVQQAKPKARQAIIDDVALHERLFDKYFLLFLVAFCTFTLVYSVYLTYLRYYL